MNDLNISIVEEWPYLKIIVKLPDNSILQDKAVWHIAASQFTPKVQLAFSKAIERIVEKHKEKMTHGNT
jgi:hypothetical protein